MKLLASPSLSSSTTTTSSTTAATSIGDADICNSSARIACFSGLMRRIFCSGSLHMNPSDHIIKTSSKNVECNTSSKDAGDEDTTATTRTGIVARLMGFESFPPKHITTSPLGDRNAGNSVLPRSFSLNSVELGGGSYEGKRKKVKSTLSFREMQGFLELKEDEEFFVLSFDENNRKGVRDFCEKWSGVRRCKMGRREFVKQRSETVMEEMLVTDKANDIFSTVFYEEDLSSTRVSNHAEFSGRLKSTKKRNKKKKKKQVNCPCDVSNEEPDSSSQDSSPVSVLDFSQFSVGRGTLRSEEGTSAGEDTNPRRKLSLELDTYNYLSERIDDNLIDNNHRISKAKREASCRSWKKKKRACHGEIWRLAQAEVVGSNWVREENCTLRDFAEDITASFVLQIFYQLLEELVQFASRN